MVITANHPLTPIESMVITIAREHVIRGDADIGPNTLAMLVMCIDRLLGELDDLVLGQERDDNQINNQGETQ